MRIKLDENVTVAVRRLFTEAGHEADTVHDEDMTGVDDDRLLVTCADEGRLLVTFDVGFGDIRAHPPGRHAGIPLMRLNDQQPAATIDVLRRVVAQHDISTFTGALVVVTEDSVRIRRE